MEEDEGQVKDLVEKLQRGEITSKEAYKRLEERGLTEGLNPSFWGKLVLDIIPWPTYFILWLLPVWSMELKLDFLEFFAQLPAFRLPAIVIYVSLVLVAIGTFFLIWAGCSHRKRGGLKKADETIIFYREGPYCIMRHPEVFGFVMWIYLLPVILSSKVPFTPLPIAAIIVMIVYFYYGTRAEEKLDIEKWGNEYQQYMKEVPRFNFIKGLWNMRKRM
jgi:protein-S-isoprenylcysteine O-methyltransferase Ste14